MSCSSYAREKRSSRDRGLGVEAVEPSSFEGVVTARFRGIVIREALLPYYGIEYVD